MVFDTSPYTSCECQDKEDGCTFRAAINCTTNIVLYFKMEVKLRDLVNFLIGLG